MQLLVPRVDDAGGLVMTSTVHDRDDDEVVLAALASGGRGTATLTNVTVRSYGGAMRVASDVARRRVVVPPRGATRLGPVLLRASRVGPFVAALRVANNLTVIESISISAHVRAAAFVLPRNATHIAFDFDARDMRRACSSVAVANYRPLELRRVVQMTNPGSTPMRVGGVSLDGRLCCGATRDGAVATSDVAAQCMSVD